MLKVCSLTCLLVMAPIPGRAGTGPARAELEAFNHGLDAIHCQFTQTVIGQDGQITDSGKGELWVARPARFRWAYEGEFPELIVADGTHIWLYDASLQQVTVKDQSNLANNSPLMLLANLQGLDTEFTVTERGEDGDMQMLDLAARGKDSEFQRVTLGLRQNQVVMMTMEDAFGMRTEIHFLHMQRNPELKDSLFEFTPPPGTDVVGDMAGSDSS